MIRVGSSNKKNLTYESIPETIWEGNQEEDEESLDHRREKKRKRRNVNNSASPEREAISD
jgi:hypothetical protein